MSTYTDLDGLGSGAIEFGCDLTGTDTCQTVVGLQGRTLSNNAPTDGQFLVWNAGASAWVPTSAGAFSAGGDLSGNSTNQTVIGIQTVDVASTTPTNNQVLLYNSSNTRWEPTTLTFTGGDLSGTYPATTVAKINGATVPAAGALTTGNVLQVNGVSSLTYAPVNLAGGANYVTGTLPVGNLPNLAGDVTGAITSNSVVKIRGKDLDADLATIGVFQDGYVLTWVDGSTEWQAKPGSGGVSIVGTIDSQSKSADALVISGSTIYAQTADASFPGMVSTGTQTFAGNKTLSGATTLSALGLGIVHSSSGGALTSSLIVNADVSASAAIVYSKLNLSNSIVNADINASAAIAYSKLSLTDSIVNADINTAAAIAVSKLAAGTAAQLLLNNSTPTPTWTTMSGDGTISSTGVLTITDITGASGFVDVSSAGNIFRWAAATTAPGITQSSTSGGSGADMTISAQPATGASNNGGGLILAGGTSGSATAGTVVLKTADTTRLTVGAGGVITVANLSTGLVHADSSGNLTSSLLVNADVSSSAAIAVSKLAAGTAGQFLQNNSTPTPTWTTMSGDGTLSSAGALSVTDLTGASGTVDIAATGNILTWAAATTAPGIAQTSTSGGSGADMSIIAQGATGASNNGGGLVLAGGTSGSATAGTVVLKTANTTRLTAGATGVITIANLSTGLVHADSSGNLTSSLLVNADVDGAAAIAYSKLNLSGSIVNADVNASAAIAYSKLNLAGSIVNADVATAAAIAVSKLAAGTAGQLLLNNATPTPTWTTVSGDATISSAGAVTVAKIQGNAVKAETLGAGQNNYVLTWINANNQWEAQAQGGITWANDLAASTSTNQYVAAISGSGGGGGTVALNITTLQFAAAQASANISQASTSGGDAVDMTIAAQGATGAGNDGGNLILSAGTSGSAVAGVVKLNGTLRQLVSSGKTADYNVVRGDGIILIGSLSGDITLNLPSSPATGDTYKVKCSSSVSISKRVRLLPASGNIEGASSFIIGTPYTAVEVVYTGSEWSVL